MKLTIPKTKAQQDFESKIQSLVDVLSEMDLPDIQKVLEFAIFIAN